MTVGVTQARRDRRARRGLRLHRQHLGLARGVCGAGGAPRAGAGARGQRGHREAGAVARLRRAHAPGPRRLRRLSPAGAGGERAARRLPAQLDQPVPARGPEDDRARAAPAARLESARLDRASGGQPGEHRRVRKGAAGGARVGPDRPDAPARRGAGGGRGPVRAELRGRLPRRATGSSPRRWRPRSGSATPPRTTARCARSGRPTAWSSR